MAGSRWYRKWTMKKRSRTGLTYEAEDVGGRDSGDKEHAKAAGDERGYDAISERCGDRKSVV